MSTTVHERQTILALRMQTILSGGRRSARLANALERFSEIRELSLEGRAAGAGRCDNCGMGNIAADRVVRAVLNGKHYPILDREFRRLGISLCPKCLNWIGDRA